MIRNIIFDWSGTLVDDLPAVWEATNHVLRLAGLAELTLEKFREEFRLPFKDFYDQRTPHLSIQQLETWFKGHFETSRHEIREIPHARQFLQSCRDAGVQTFVLSSVLPEWFEVQALKTGLKPFIQHAYTGVRDKKALIRQIIAEHQLAPEETLLVGDMQHDMETAHEGGLFACAVLTGYNSSIQLRESKPHLLVEHLGELRMILEQSGWNLQAPLPEAHPVTTVGALVMNSRDEVLMIRTFKWSNLWGIPGGKIRLGETAEDALRRELKEETNLEVRDIRFVLVQDCIDSPEFYRKAHFVLLNYTCRTDDGSDVRLNEEAQEFRWLQKEEAFSLPLNTPTRILLEAVFR